MKNLCFEVRQNRLIEFMYRLKTLWTFFKRVFPKPTRLELRPASRKRQNFQEWLKSLPDTWRVDKVRPSKGMKTILKLVLRKACICTMHSYSFVTTVLKINCAKKKKNETYFVLCLKKGKLCNFAKEKNVLRKLLICHYCAQNKNSY